MIKRSTVFPKPSESDLFYTADDLAERWRISRDAVYRISETLLPYLRLGPKGGARRYRPEDIKDYEHRMATNKEG